MEITFHYITVSVFSKESSAVRDEHAWQGCWRMLQAHYEMFLHNRSPYLYLNTDAGNDYVSLFFRTATHLVILWVLPGACGLIFVVSVCTVMQEYTWAVLGNDISIHIIVNFFGQHTTLFYKVLETSCFRRQAFLRMGSLMEGSVTERKSVIELHFWLNSSL